MDRKKIARTRSFGLAIVLTLASLGTVTVHTAPALAASGNLLTNADMEGGTTGWSVFGAGTLASNTSVVHGGARSLLRTRAARLRGTGPRQSVTSAAGKWRQLHDERMDAYAERNPDRAKSRCR